MTFCGPRQRVEVRRPRLEPHILIALFAVLVNAVLQSPKPTQGGPAAAQAGNRWMG